MPAEAALSRFGWAEMVNIVRHLPDDSATWRALHPDEAPWTSRLALAHFLADIHDAITGLAWLFASAHSKSRPKRPRPYPVPWAKGEEQRLGKDAIAIADFDEWYYGGD